MSPKDLLARRPSPSARRYSVGSSVTPKHTMKSRFATRGGSYGTLEEDQDDQQSDDKGNSTPTSCMEEEPPLPKSQRVGSYQRLYSSSRPSTPPPSTKLRYAPDLAGTSSSFAMGGARLYSERPASPPQPYTHASMSGLISRQHGFNGPGPSNTASLSPLKMQQPSGPVKAFRPGTPSRSPPPLRSVCTTCCALALLCLQAR